MPTYTLCFIDSFVLYKLVLRAILFILLCIRKYVHSIWIFLSHKLRCRLKISTQKCRNLPLQVLSLMVKTWGSQKGALKGLYVSENHVHYQHRQLQIIHGLRLPPSIKRDVSIYCLGTRNKLPTTSICRYHVQNVSQRHVDSYLRRLLVTRTVIT